MLKSLLLLLVAVSTATAVSDISQSLHIVGEETVPVSRDTFQLGKE